MTREFKCEAWGRYGWVAALYEDGKFKMQLGRYADRETCQAMCDLAASWDANPTEDEPPPPTNPWLK